MGIMRYKVLKIEEYRTSLAGLDVYKVTTIKELTDDTELQKLANFCEAWARTQTDKWHKIQYAILPWFDCSADVCEQPTAYATPPAPRLAAPVTISENVPDVSQMATARLIMPPNKAS